MQTFVTQPVGILTSPPAATRRSVLVTGAAGNIGLYFAQQSGQRYMLRLMVHHVDADPHAGDLQPHGELVGGDLDDLPTLKKLCSGIDTIVHMAGDPRPNATWASLLQANIVGSYNLFVAAKAAGCRRVIYASSIHAVSGYPADYQVHTNDPVNPGDLYGVSKCFGEAMGRYMAEKEGLSVICLRIGAFQPLATAQSPGRLDIADCFVSQRDLNQLIERCIDADDGLRFAIFHGLSNNRFKRLDITDARELVGYNPIDDFTQLNPLLKDIGLHDKVQSQSQGDQGDEESGIRDDVK